jgi:hypothetical protein
MHGRLLFTSAIAFVSSALWVGAHQPVSGVNELWREPDLSRIDVFYGPGGQADAPQPGRVTFIKEDLDGTQPKFDVVDAHGVRWKVKLGPEARPEVAATRLVWAAGYFADEDYYLPELQVDGLAALKRGQKYLSPAGLVTGARLERSANGERKAGHWSWTDNPFTGSRELDGLKVLLALINDWDLKAINNDIYEERDGARHYAVADLGASFGRNSNEYARSKGDADGYRQSAFIRDIRSDEVDFVLFKAPFWVDALRTVHAREYGRMDQLVRHIPRDHATWIGHVLAQLSNEQIAAAFRAASFTPEEVDELTATVRDRIARLNAL